MTRASDLARLIGAGGTVANDVTISEGSPSIKLNDTDTSRFIDILYGTRNATFRNTMASGEDMDTVAPEIIFSTKDDGETREHFRMNKSEAVFNEGSVDLDFRVESNGNANMFVVDGGNDRVGIGISNPSTVLHVRGADATDTLTVGNTVENTQCTIRTHQDDRAVISATDGGTNRNLAFATGTTERARIDGGTGNLMLGTSSSTYNLGRIVSDVNLASYHTAVFRNNTNNTNGLFLRLMNYAGQDCGSISQTGTTSSQFTGTSDYRVKENIKYDFDGTSKIKQIKPCVFNFIADGVDSTQEGFIAHELQDIVPIAVVGKKDEMETYTDDDGKEQTRPRLQGVDNSKIVPLLVKTIQELEARITALESK